MKISLLLLAAAALCANVVKATTIYSNFDSNFDYQAGTGLAAGAGAAVPFTLELSAPQGFAYALTEIQIAAFNSSDPASDPVTVALYSDAGGVPGAELAASQPINLTVDPALIPVNFTDGPELATGDQYWVVLTENSGETNVTWNLNCADSSSPCDSIVNGEASIVSSGAPFFNDSWQYNSGGHQGAVEVDAALQTMAPEPGTVAMLGGGVFALLLMAVRRRLPLTPATGPESGNAA